MITEKDEEEEEEKEPKLTWYQLASKPNYPKFLVLLFGVPESDDISDEFIEDYNILLVRGCAVKQDKPVPIEVKVPLAYENNFKPAEVYRIFYKQRGVVKVHIKGSLITSTKLLMFTFTRTFRTAWHVKILYNLITDSLKLILSAYGHFRFVSYRTVRGVTHEGVSLSIPGNEKRYETVEVLNVFLDFDAKDVKGSGFRRPDSLQNLCGSSRRPKQSQNIIGILRAHDGCATPSATSDLPAYNDLGDWKNSFRDHGQQNQPIYRNHFKATLTDGTADGQFFMPAVDEVIGCTCSELAQRYKQVHPHQTLSLSAEVNRTPV
ncbi:hypothetical protein Tco_1522747, partial [Tanacetum coccineum]